MADDDRLPENTPEAASDAHAPHDAPTPPADSGPPAPISEAAAVEQVAPPVDAGPPAADAAPAPVSDAPPPTGRHPASFLEERLADDVEVRKTRRSGPGGQHRNKVETAVVLKHLASGVQAEASERRSAGDNRSVAFFRLRVNLALEVRRAAALDQPPGEVWRERVHGSKINVSPTHRDFPTLLAEALDRLSAAGFDFGPAAESLGVTPSQLMKFLRIEPRAWLLVNRNREERGMHRLQ